MAEYVFVPAVMESFDHASKPDYNFFKQRTKKRKKDELVHKKNDKVCKFRSLNLNLMEPFKTPYASMRLHLDMFASRFPGMPKIYRCSTVVVYGNLVQKVNKNISKEPHKSFRNKISYTSHYEDAIKI